MNYSKIGIHIFGWAAVLYPLWTRWKTLEWGPNADIIANVFPLFGLLAFSLLWLHSLAGVFEPWLKKHINLGRFVDITATIILISMIAHPLLLFMGSRFDINFILTAYGTKYMILAVFAWLLLITYDISKPLKKQYGFFARHWNKVLIISTIGFLMTFFHSLVLGSDLQEGPLRAVWIFYGITAILATVWTYGIKKFMKLKA